MTNLAVVSFASDEEFEAWVYADVREVAEGKAGNEPIALAEGERRDFDLEPIRERYRQARGRAGEAATEQTVIKPAADFSGMRAKLERARQAEEDLGRRQLALVERAVEADEKIEALAEENELAEIDAKIAELQARKEALEVGPTALAQLSLDPLTVATPDKVLAAMNVRHAVIGNIGGKCLALDWIKDPIDNSRLIPSFQRRSAIEDRYASIPVLEDGKKVGLGAWWWKHPRRASYRAVTFEPGGPEALADGHMNLWRGWGVVPQEGDWSRMRWHIENILAAGDPRAADYIIRWLAYGFQHPDRQAETAVILRGPEGCGKGILGRGVRQIYGPHGFQISQPRHLTGKFNAHLWTCCFLFADEAFWAGDKQAEGILKSLITEDVLMIERKMIDQFQAKNFVKLMLASNEGWVIPAGQNARRYSVNDVDPRYGEGHASDAEREGYFKLIYEELRSGGLGAMLYDLTRMDLEEWHPRMIYRTAALMHQKKVSLRGNRQWYEVLLQRGSLPKPIPNRPDRIITDDLIEWARTFRGCEYLNDTSLSEFLRSEVGFTEENRFRLPKGGKRGWQFPLLSDARRAWEKLYGGAWDWTEEIAVWGG
jgi:hypothetical protein